MARKRKQSRAPGLKVRWRSGIAYAVGTLPGYDKPIRRSLRATGQADADAACIALQTKLLKDVTEKSTKGPTFGEAANSYLATWEDRRRERREARGGKYVFSYRWYQAILERLRDVYIVDITTGMIAQIAMDMLPEGTPQYRNRHISRPIVATINHYADMGKCSPVRGPKIGKDTKAKAKRVFVTRDWVDKFLAASRELTAESEDATYLKVGAACMFMYMTGARRSEVAEWFEVKHFDLDKRLATLPPVFTKTDEEGTFLLPRELVMLLREIMPETGKVFGLPYADAIYAPWREICARAEINYVPPHQAGRHSFGTEVGKRVGKDISVADGADMGRWKDRNVFLNTYVHAADDLLKNVDDIFEQPKKGLKIVGGKE